MDIWRTLHIPVNQATRAHIGFKHIWIFNAGTEWRIAVEWQQQKHADTPELKTVKKPRRNDWQRWIKRDSGDTVSLKPILPILSLVVRSEYTLRIPPRTDTTLFIVIPAWIELSTPGTRGQVMIQTPTISLSHTWFGDNENGELCYSLKSTLLSRQEDISSPGYRVICPLSIKNISQDALEFKNVCLPVRFLAIYKGSEHLWTNEVLVEYRGEEVPPSITSKQHAPRFGRNLLLLQKPEEKINGSLLKKTFSKFTEIAGF